MAAFLSEVFFRNPTLFYFGGVCLILSVLFLVLSKTSKTQVNNISAWYKPFKFAFSIMLYSGTMAWYCYYLPDFNTTWFNWTVVILFGFEIVYIAIQAGRGQLSHFNSSKPVYAFLYFLMGMAAAVVTAYTLYIGILFCIHDFPTLPIYYVWAIRLGIFIFVVFSFEGFLMGANLKHTIGGPDGEEGIPFLNWSKKYGDPRVAHFIGMHALQIVPLLSFYVLKNTAATVVISVAYALLALFTLYQAVQGRPFVKGR